MAGQSGSTTALYAVPAATRSLLDVHEVLTKRLGSGRALPNIDLALVPNLSRAHRARAVARPEPAIRRSNPEVDRSFVGQRRSFPEPTPNRFGVATGSPVES